MPLRGSRWLRGIVHMCVVAVAFAVFCGVSVGSALADTVAGRVVTAAPTVGQQMQFSFTGSAAAANTELMVLVQPAGGLGCQPTFNDDQAAVPGFQVIFGGNYTVGPGAFTAASATYTPNNSGSFVACLWLQTVAPAPSGPPTTTAGPVSVPFSVAAPPPPPPPPPPPASASALLAGATVASRPAVGLDAAQDEFVFWQGPGSQLYEGWYESGRWNGPSSIPLAGKIASAPAVAVHRAGEQDVFWRAADGTLRETWYDGQWHHPIKLNSGRVASDPAAGVDATGREYLFWTAPGGGLREMVFNSGHWARPTRVSVAGRVTSDPAVVVRSSGEQDLFWRGAGGALFEATRTNRWHAKVNLGNAPLGSAPTAGIDGSGNLYVFWRGKNAGLWETWQENGRWQHTALAFAGSLGSPPVVAVHASGQQDVLWAGTDNGLWEAENQNGNWL